MSISSVYDYNVLLTEVTEAVIDKANEFYRKVKNGTVTIFDKIRIILLYKYLAFLENSDVYEEFVLAKTTYVVGDFVSSSTERYLCVKDSPGSISLSNREYWVQYPTFTYNYNNIIDTLNNINRICGTNFII